MTIQEDRSRALALAGGMLVTALLEALVDKNVLSASEVRSVMLKAISGAGKQAQSPLAYEARGMIAAIMRDRFPQDSVT